MIDPIAMAIFALRGAAQDDPQMSASIVTGIFTLSGTLLGAALGLFGERWVRTWGKVRCDLRWLAWVRGGSADSPGGVKVEQRRLEVTFLNRKDVPVTVWDMRVTFYRGDQPSTQRSARAWSSNASKAVQDGSSGRPFPRAYT